MVGRWGLTFCKYFLQLMATILFSTVFEVTSKCLFPQEFTDVWSTVALLMHLSALLTTCSWWTGRSSNLYVLEYYHHFGTVFWYEIVLIVIAWLTISVAIVELLRCFHTPMLFILVYCNLLAWLYFLFLVAWTTLDRQHQFHIWRGNFTVGLDQFFYRLLTLRYTLQYYCEKNWLWFSVHVATRLHRFCFHYVPFFVWCASEMYDMLTLTSADLWLLFVSRLVWPLARKFFRWSGLNRVKAARQALDQVPNWFGSAYSQFQFNTPLMRPRFRWSYKFRDAVREAAFRRARPGRRVTLGILVALLLSFFAVSKATPIKEKKERKPYPNHRQRRLAERNRRLYLNVNREQLLELAAKKKGTSRNLKTVPYPTDEYGFLLPDPEESQQSYDSWCAYHRVRFVQGRFPRVLRL